MSSRDKKKKSHADSVNDYARKVYDRIQVLAPKGEKGRWTAEALKRGFVSDKGQVSVSRFVRWCVEEKIGKPQLNSAQLDCNDAQNDIE